MPISTDFTSVFSKEWEINVTQCAPNGRLRYTDLCNLLQMTAAVHAEKGGISFTDMQEFDQAWVLSRMRVEIDELPQCGEIITVKTWIVSLEKSRSVRALEVYIGDRKLIGCETFWAVFNTKIRRPEMLALPDAHFTKYGERHPTLHRVSKIKIPEQMVEVLMRPVVFSDLDIVNHVNNVKYLEWCLDTVAPEMLSNGQIVGFDMNFLKELVFGDSVIIEAGSECETPVYVVSKNSKPCFVLKLHCNHS